MQKLNIKMKWEKEAKNWEMESEDMMVLYWLY
jgi:hypothetical protein